MWYFLFFLLDFRTVLTVWYFLFFLLDFRTVLTVWYFLFFVLLCILLNEVLPLFLFLGGCRGRDRMIYYLTNLCLSPQMWVRISIRSRCTTLCDKVRQWLSTGRWFSPGPPVYSANKTDSHNIAKILLRVALNTVKPNLTNSFLSFLIINMLWLIIISHLYDIYIILNRGLHLQTSLDQQMLILGLNTCI